MGQAGARLRSRRAWTCFHCSLCLSLSVFSVQRLHYTWQFKGFLTTSARPTSPFAWQTNPSPDCAPFFFMYFKIFALRTFAVVHSQSCFKMLNMATNRFSLLIAFWIRSLAFVSPFEMSQFRLTQSHLVQKCAPELSCFSKFCLLLFLRWHSTKNNLISSAHSSVLRYEYIHRGVHVPAQSTVSFFFFSCHPSSAFPCLFLNPLSGA